MVIDFFGGLFDGKTNITFILLFFSVIIIIYSLFVYYFYRFLAKKNILELNLNQYNQYENPTAVKILAVVFYIIEYIILLPIITFFWFSVLSILILVLAEGVIKVETILLISAALVASVRVVAYISEELSRDLAKMLPFTLLAIAITKPGFFNIDALFSRISGIPGLISIIPQYLLFIVAIELTMRISDFIGHIFNQTEETEEEEKS